MKKIQDFKVLKYRMLNELNYVIELKSEEDIPEVKAGNFAELKVPDSPDVFLRRPISILNVDHSTKTLSFYIKIVGKGTRKLSELQVGQTVSIIFPLGNSFTANSEKKVLMVGGGSGIAPFILLGKELKEKNITPVFLLGARSKDDIFLTEGFSQYGDVLITTEDGSLGEKGLVTDHTVFSSGEFDFDKIYTCGPDPMMKAVAKIAMERDIECEASLENMMACGFGACLCCVTETIDGNKCVCTEGPVFNVKELKW